MIVLIRTIFNIIMPACVLLLILLAVLAWGPVYFDTSEILNNAGLQRTRVEVITNDAQRLETLPDQDVTTIGSLQAALPAWEKEQSTLASYHDPQLQAYLQDSNSPYQLIDKAAHTILNEYNNDKQVDTTQIKIVQSYEHQYLLTMNDLVFYIQQQSEAINQWIAATQEIIITLVVVAVVVKYVLLRKYIYPHLIELEKSKKDNKT